MKLDRAELEKLIATVVGKHVAEKWAESHAKAVEAEVAKQLGKVAPADPARKYMDTLASNSAKAFRNTPLGKKPVEQMTAAEKGLMAARCLRYQFAAKGDMDLALRIAKSADDDNAFNALSKALGEQTIAAGGALIPPDFAAGVIELLYPATTVRGSGVTVLDMPAGSLELPYVATGATAGYTTEGVDITASEETFGILKLVWRKLTALVPLSNDMLRHGGDRIDAIIRDDLVRALAAKEDVAFLRSTGAAGEPMGLKNQVAAANTFAANTTETIATATEELGRAIQLLEEANVGMGNLAGAGWIFAPRTKKALLTARTSTGDLIFKPEMESGNLMGYPFKTTSQIPTNLGGASQSEVYFAHWPTIVIGEDTAIQIEMFANAAYVDSGGTVRSGISRDQSVMRAIQRHDIGCRQRGNEVAVITAVEWGKSTLS